MKIMFICKYNRFRSKVAEYYFNKLSKKNKAISSGFIEMDKPLMPKERKKNKYLKEKFGIKFNSKSQGIQDSKLEKQDKIIIVANDVPPTIFDKKAWKSRIEVWKIPDEPATDKKNIDKSVNLILSKIKKWIEKNEN